MPWVEAAVSAPLAACRYRREELVPCRELAAHTRVVLIQDHPAVELMNQRLGWAPAGDPKTMRMEYLLKLKKKPIREVRPICSQLRLIRVRPQRAQVLMWMDINLVLPGRQEWVFQLLPEGY